MKQTQAFQWLTTSEEKQEVYNVVKQLAILKSERPQSDFKGGWLRMWTILNPFYDKRGYNRQYSTFSEEGLTELGIKP